MNFPTQWTVAQLGDLTIRIVGGGTPSKALSANFEGAIPFMTVKDMKARFVESTVDHISEEAIRGSATTMVPADTLIVATRMSLGKIVRPKLDVAINQDLKALFLEEEVEKTYIEYFWRSKSQAIQAMGTGTTVKGIRLEDIRTLAVPLAPKNEQKRIADKLDTVLTRVDAVNTRLARIAPLLKRFRQAVLAAAMAGKLTSDWRDANEAEDAPQVPIDTNEDAGSWSFSSLPASWTACRFDTCFSDETDSTRKVPQANYVINGTLAVVDQGQSLIGGYTNDLAMISICQSPVLVFGDHTRIVKWVDFPFAQGADGVKVLRPRLKVHKFAYMLLQAITLPDKGYSRHYKYLKRSVFPVPPTEEQAEIVRRVETLFAFADRLEARLKSAQTAADRLTPSLLAKAFRGELVPQDPNDEPASELLKRLVASTPVSPTNRGRAKSIKAV